MRLILSLLLIFSAQVVLSAEIKAQTQTPSCPSLKISCPTDVVWPSTPTTLSLNISGGSPQTNLKYRWSLSEGEIASGQETTQIIVDTSHINGQKVTATVEVDGMRDECDKVANCEFSVIGCGLLPPAMKFDEYDNLNWTDESASRQPRHSVTTIPGRMEGLCNHLWAAPRASTPGACSGLFSRKAWH